MNIFLFFVNDNLYNKNVYLERVLFFLINSLYERVNKMTEKHLIITGTSKVSWKDAIVKAVAEVSETIDYISSIKIVEQRANINENKISEYFADIDLSFIVDRDHK